METRLRTLIVLTGLPEPTVNHVVRDLHGRKLYRFDLSCPDLKIVVAYDAAGTAPTSTGWTPRPHFPTR